MSRRRTSLAVRVTLLVTAVAVLVAVIASVAGVLVVRRTLIDVTTEALADRADVIAAQLASGSSGTGNPPDAGNPLAVADAVLAEQGITVVTIGPDGEFSEAGRVAERAAAEAGAHLAVGGRSVSGTAVAGGRLQLVEARSSQTGGFALVTPADVAAATRQALERRLLWAVLGGTAVAVLVGLLVARAVSAPLRRTAVQARAMSAGARDRRAPVAGPREVAEVAVAVNELADALQHSESRQRDFLASVSHELRTPLAGISGQGQALADGLVDPAEQADVGASIVGEAARLERLVTDLLDLARLGADNFSIDPAPTDLVALVTEMATAWQPRCAARGVPLLVEVPTFPVVVSTDARRVRQVLDGLAENALRVLEPGRPLVLHVGAVPNGSVPNGLPSDPVPSGPVPGGHVPNSPVPSGTIPIGTVPDGPVPNGPGPTGLPNGPVPNGAVLQVRDGGPGLAFEDYPVAFERGVLHERYRTRRPGGAGLGLALAHSLIVRLGGTITATPAPERGVAMTIWLPADAPYGGPPAVAPWIGQPTGAPPAGSTWTGEPTGSRPAGAGPLAGGPWAGAPTASPLPGGPEAGGSPRRSPAEEGPEQGAHHA